MPRRRSLSPRWRALLAGQHGVFSLEQADRLGVPRALLADRVRRGVWQRLLPKVYVAQAGPPNRLQWREAAVLYVAPDGALDDVDALAELGLRYLPPDDGRVRVVVPDARRLRSRARVVVRRTSGPIETTPRTALPSLATVGAVVAVCRRLRAPSAVHALVAEVVQRGMLSVDELLAAVGAAPRSGSAELRRAAEAVAAGTRSAPEAEFRQLVSRLRVPEPLWNPLLELPDGSCVSPDAYWEEAALVHETDSVAHHRYGAAWEETMRRHGGMTAAGLLVLHSSPWRIRTDPALGPELERSYAYGRRRGPAPGVRVIRHSA